MIGRRPFLFQGLMTAYQRRRRAVRSDGDVITPRRGRRLARPSPVTAFRGVPSFWDEELASGEALACLHGRILPHGRPGNFGLPFGGAPPLFVRVLNLPSSEVPEWWQS